MQGMTFGPVSTPWRLAASAWPRSAGDPAHRRRSSLPLPRHARARRVCEQAGGLALGEDGRLRMSVGGRLLALDEAGGLAWQLDLCEGEALEHARALSSPALLAGDVAVCASRDALYFVDAQGRLLTRIDLALHAPLDDSGPAINLAPDGRLVCATMSYLLVVDPEGGVTPLDPRGRGGVLGYDLLPPAIDEAGRMVVCAHAGVGLAGLHADGSLRWRSGLRDADLLPTLDHASRAAGGSVNDDASWIVDAEGEVLARLPLAAAFAVAADGWIALGRRAIVASDPQGVVRWRREGGARARWAGLGPIVDVDERIAVPCDDRLLVLEPDGRTLVDVELPALADPRGGAIDLAPWGAGRLALARSDGLYLLE